jgi:hypothetical protein
VPHLIDFWMIRERPNSHETYLKATPVPGAKKEAKRRAQVYKQVMGSS